MIPLQFSSRLQEAVEVGMVKIQDYPKREAWICAPPDFMNLTDDEILNILQAAGEVGRELEFFGYLVHY